MNKELGKFILEYEAVSASRDLAAEQANQIFEAHLDEVLSRHPDVSRENLRKSIIRAHHQ